MNAVDCSSKDKGSKANTSSFKLQPEQIVDIKKAFDIYDFENSGYITVRKMRLAMLQLGFEPITWEISYWMDVVDKAHTGSIGLTDFLEFIRLKMAVNDPNIDLISAFSSFDDDCTGKISFNNFRRVTNELNLNLSDEEVQEMINTVDFDGDGELGYDDVITVINENKFYT